MALEGNLKDFGLADILQLIYFQKKTGVLSLQCKTDAVRILFHEGNVAGASSKRREESNRIGRLLVQRGLLTEDDLEAALDKSRTSAERLGRTLLDAGKVSVEDIRSALSEQITQTVVQIFNWKEGHYEFVPQEVTLDSKVSVAIDTDQILMEGLRVTDEWSLYDGKVGLDAIYQPVGIPDAPLPESEAAVYTHVDGHNDVNTIMDLTTLDQIEAARAIVALAEKGFIQELVVTEVAQVAGRTGRKGVPDRIAMHAVAAGLLFLMLGVAVFQSVGVFGALGRFSKGVTLERVRLGLETQRARSGRVPDRLSELGSLAPLAEETGLRYEPGKGVAGYLLSAPDRAKSGGDPIR